VRLSFIGRRELPANVPESWRRPGRAAPETRHAVGRP